MDRSSSPSLLPIFRSQQQAELLTLVLGDASGEHSLTDLADRSGIPYPSVHREIARAHAAGLVTSRSVGRTRLIRADTSSPYFAGLSDVLVKAFGPPHVLSRHLSGIPRIDAAYIFGSWAARSSGTGGDRPVGDIDLLVLGAANRDDVYAAASRAEAQLGRDVQVTLRSSDWLKEGAGSFHATVVDRPLVPVPLVTRETSAEDRKRSR